MYKLHHFLTDFTMDEMLEGAELVLQDRILKKEKKSMNDKQILLAAFLIPEDRSYQKANCLVELDEENGELISTECDCWMHSTNGFGCAHTAAVVLDDLLERFGWESFESTPLNEALARRTGVNRPFMPGILRPTHMLLSVLLQENASSETFPDRKRPDGPHGLMKVEVILHPYDPIAGEAEAADGVTLELRAGIEKLYVVKNLQDFLEQYESGGKILLGKKDFFLTAANFEPDSGRMVQFLNEIRQIGLAHGHSEYQYLEAFSPFRNKRRELQIKGRDLDALMQLAEQVPMKVSGDRLSPALRYEKQEKALTLELRKQTFGATLSTEGIHLLGAGADALYFYDDDHLFSISSTLGSNKERLLELLSVESELFVRDEDLPALCRDFMIPLKEDAEIKEVGMSLDIFLPEMPKMEFFLDLPQDDYLVIQGKAVYTTGTVLLGVSHPEDGKIGRRNLSEERRIEQLLISYFTAPEVDSAGKPNGNFCEQVDEEELYQMLTQVVPILSSYGEVFISDALKKIQVRKMGQVAVGVRVRSSLLEISVRSEEFSMEELSDLLSAYRKKKKYHRLKDGSFVTLEEGDTSLESLSELYQMYGKKNPEQMKVPLYRALYFDDRMQKRDEQEILYRQDHSYRELLSNVHAAKDQNYKVPESVRSVLRPYQEDGYRWIRTLKSYGFGGILADDMGLGKTLQLLTALLALKEEGNPVRTLIVAPASLVYNWQKEIRKFTPSLSCCMITGTAEERKALISGENPADIWITSYHLLCRDIEFYEDLSFENEIIDEAQFIKNHTTQAARAVKLIQSSFRMALTGTPIENHLSELWSIFDYLMPGFLYSYAHFRKELETPIVTKQDEKSLQKLRALIQPFVLRRLKKEVLTELPDKLEEVVSIELTGEQRKLYDAHEQRLRLFLQKEDDEAFKNGKLELLAELTKLRQLCCGPEVFVENYRGNNAKMEACLELLHRAIDGGHKVLLFSQFTSLLDELGKRLEKENIRYHRLDGSTPKETRMELVDAFAVDDVPLFCISLKAGGTGLNLTAADVVIHYDPWWNVAAQNQATDRTHRIGQTHVVTVYQLLAENTIEERIRALQEEKAKLASDVLGGEQMQSIRIDRDEILKLLSDS